jgi:flagellar protein FliO/FliZ
MHDVDYVRAFAALLAVLGAIGLGVWLLKRLDINGWLARCSISGSRLGAAGRHLSVLETRIVDARTKIVLLRWDETEHLLLLGQAGSILLATRQSSRADRP